MMSLERVLHGDTKGEIYATLRGSGSARGLPCKAYPDGVAVDRREDHLPARSVGFPWRRPPPDAQAITDPIIVVEVLSPSTAAIDHGRKLSGYFSLPSVEHYLILDPERRAVIHHKRGQGDAIETRVLTNGVARLDPPAFEVAVEALFPLLDG
jgi:Uma2 family endonuclease